MKFFISLSLLILSLSSYAQNEFNAGVLVGYNTNNSEITNIATDLNSGNPVPSSDYSDSKKVNGLCFGVTGRGNVYEIDDDKAIFVEAEATYNLEGIVNIPAFVSFGWGMGATSYSNEYIGLSFGVGVNYNMVLTDEPYYPYDRNLFTGVSPIVKAAFHWDSGMGMQSISFNYHFAGKNNSSFEQDNMAFTAHGVNSGFTVSLYMYLIQN